MFLAYQASPYNCYYTSTRFYNGIIKTTEEIKMKYGNAPYKQASDINI